MSLIPLFFVILAIIGVVYFIRQNQAKKNKEQLEISGLPFEEKLILLLKESNKRLKGIDTTLDYFFWFMIIGGVMYIGGIMYIILLFANYSL